MKNWLLILILLVCASARASAQDDPGAPRAHTTQTERIQLDFWAPPLDVRFPTDREGPRPVILLVHGWGMSSHDYGWVEDKLTSEGFAVASFNMWNPLLLGPDLWAGEAKRAVDRLFAESADPASPLHGRLDLERLGVIGHSLGGATAIKLADIDPRFKAAVALAPGADFFTQWSVSASADRTTTPLLVITGQNDFVTPTDRKLLDGHQPGKGDRLLVELRGADHWSFTRWFVPFFTSNDVSHDTASRFFNAWFAKHLSGGSDETGLTDGRAAEVGVKDGKLSKYHVRSTPGSGPDDGLPLDVKPAAPGTKAAPVAAPEGASVYVRPTRSKGFAAALVEERVGEERLRER